MLFSEHELHAPLLYDVVIIDLNLPRGLSGQEVIAHIRERIDQRSLPLIVVSGAGPDKLAQVQASYPDIPALRKPFHLHILLQLLETSKGATSTHTP